MEDAYCPAPMIAAAAIAGRTKHIRIGQGIVILPFYGHPLKLAEHTAVLDVISGGRFELGIGRGYRPHELAGFGLNQKHRRAMTDEGMQILQRVWKGERFSFFGTHYKVKDARLTPQPVQQPLPVWLGSGTRSARRNVAEQGHPLLTSFVTNLQETQAEISDYRDSLLDFGHNPTNFPRALIREFYVAEDQQQAWHEIRPHFLHICRKVYCPPCLAFYDENPDGARR